MKSQLTQQEYDQLLLDDAIAGGKPQLLYRHVSHGQLSIARYSMGARINGHHYVYNPVTDELLREDALKFLAQLRKAKKPTMPEQTQVSLI
ncbi:hypothetical protein [Undibacterium sp.]|uniref:hypothetical protein n=1 Tax=Undibacterium sp. TaxID=1914977 RepID=UPI003750C909